MPARLLVQQLLRPWLSEGRRASFELPGTLAGAARVLAVDTGDLADMLFHMPLLQGIRATHPQARIDFLLPAAHVPLVAATGLARHLLVYAPKQMRLMTPGFFALVREVRRERCQASVVMSGDPQPACELLTLASGAALRVGVSHAGAYPAVNFEVRRPSGDRSYRGTRPGAAAAPLGLRPAPAGWPLPEDKARQARQLVRLTKPRSEELLLGLDPGPGKGGGALAIQNLRFVAEELASRWSCQLLTLAAPGGEERRRELDEGLRAPTSALQRGDLLQTVLLLAQCDLFVAGNTDLFHFAVAFDVPAVGLFTEADAEEWEPRGHPRARVLRVARGERLDIDRLLEAVSAVTGRRPAPRSAAAGAYGVAPSRPRGAS